MTTPYVPSRQVLPSQWAPQKADPSLHAHAQAEGEKRKEKDLTQASVTAIVSPPPTELQLYHDQGKFGEWYAPTGYAFFTTEFR